MNSTPEGGVSVQSYCVVELLCSLIVPHLNLYLPFPGYFITFCQSNMTKHDKKCKNKSPIILLDHHSYYHFSVFLSRLFLKEYIFTWISLTVNKPFGILLFSLYYKHFPYYYINLIIPIFHKCTLYLTLYMLTNYSFVSEPLGCFYFFSIINNVATNIFVKVSSSSYFWIIALEYKSERGLLSLKVLSFL